MTPNTMKSEVMADTLDVGKQKDLAKKKLQQDLLKILNKANCKYKLNLSPGDNSFIESSFEAFNRDEQI